MGLTIIMIVLVGVMGAGLLTFVSTDLNTVVEVNQGQRAFEVADAGVQAAKKQLLTESSASGATPAVYHNKYGGTDAATNDVQWSPNISNTNCSNLGSNGMCFENLDGDGSTSDTANVTILSENASTDTFEVVSTGGYGDAKRKIEAKLQPTNRVRLRPEYYTGQDFLCDSNSTFSGSVLNFIVEDNANFKSNCTITMTSGNIYVGGASGAGLAAEFNSNTSVANGNIFINGTASFNSNTSVTNGSIFIRDSATFNSNTDFGGNGRLYVGGNATWDSNAIVSDSSIYVGGDASFDSNSGLDAASLFTAGNVTLNSNNFSLGSRPDAIYGNWQNAFNPTARGSVVSGGIGAVGTISGAGASRAFRGSRSYDAATGNGTTTGTKFVAPNNVPAPASPRRMTFPFDPAAYAQPLANATATAPDSKLTADDINALRTIAQEQEAATGRDHYREVSNGTVTLANSGTDQWPTASSSTYGYGTVVFYKFASDSNTNKVVWDVNALCDDTSRRGILVIENGNFEAGRNAKGFNGWIVVPNGTFGADSNSCMHAYAYAQDGLTTNSNSNIFDLPSSALTDLNQFRTVNVLSWRELYQ